MSTLLSFQKLKKHDFCSIHFEGVPFQMPATEAAFPCLSRCSDVQSPSVQLLVILGQTLKGATKVRYWQNGLAVNIVNCKFAERWIIYSLWTSKLLLHFIKLPNDSNDQVSIHLRAISTKVQDKYCLVMWQAFVHGGTLQKFQVKSYQNTWEDPTFDLNEHPVTVYRRSRWKQATERVLYCS